MSVQVGAGAACFVAAAVLAVAGRALIDSSVVWRAIDDPLFSPANARRQRPASPAAAYDGPPIGVRAVHVPPAFDRIEIPLPTSGGRFIVAENRHWAAPLGRLAAQTLTEDLARQLLPASVLWPHLRWPQARAEVTVDILSLTLTPQGFEASFRWQMCESAPQDSPNCRPAGQSGAGGESRFTSVAAEVAPLDGAERTARAVSEILAVIAADISAGLTVPR